MPEGPECTRTCRQLDRASRGKSLVNLNFISGRYVKNLPTGFADFYIALEEQNLPIRGVFNKGKFMLCICYIFTSCIKKACPSRTEQFDWNSLSLPPGHKFGQRRLHDLFLFCLFSFWY